MGFCYSKNTEESNFFGTITNYLVLGNIGSWKNRPWSQMPCPLPLISSTMTFFFHSRLFMAVVIGPWDQFPGSSYRLDSTIIVCMITA